MMSFQVLGSQFQAAFPGCHRRDSLAQAELHPAQRVPRVGRIGKPLDQSLDRFPGGIVQLFVRGAGLECGARKRVTFVRQIAAADLNGVRRMTRSTGTAGDQKRPCEQHGQDQQNRENRRD